MAMQMMLIGVSILALCMSDRACADEAGAVKTIENLGGNIRRDKHLPGSPVVEVGLGDTKLTDADLKELKAFAGLTSLDLARTQVTDLGLKELKNLKQLTRLVLCRTKVTDAGIVELKDLKQLKELFLRGTEVTDAGVADLQKALPSCKITS
jgi:internalin A